MPMDSQVIDGPALAAMLARHSVDLRALHDRHAIELGNMIVMHAKEIVASDIAPEAPVVPVVAPGTNGQDVRAPDVAGARRRG